MANGDEQKQSLEFQRETVRILREQTDALKEQQRASQQTAEQIKAQLSRIVPVSRVTDLTVEAEAIEREMALVKVAGIGEKRVEALRVSESFRARVVDTTHESFVFELTGAKSKIDAFVHLMRPLGLKEVSRTGIAAIARGPEAM